MMMVLQPAGLVIGIIRLLRSVTFGVRDHIIMILVIGKMISVSYVKVFRIAGV